MEPGFSLAGEPIVYKKQREGAVRPQEDEGHKLLQPITEEVAGDLEAEQDVEGEAGLRSGDEQQMEKLDEKYQSLKDKMEEYFDDENGTRYRQPPVLRSPPQPTREEYERHQATHTPYAPWCKHCVVARAVRRHHLWVSHASWH